MKEICLIEKDRDTTMRLNFPVLTPITFVKNAVSALEEELSKPQRVNLMLILTAVITWQEVCKHTLSLLFLRRS
jgi:hypothetical protein